MKILPVLTESDGSLIVFAEKLVPETNSSDQRGAAVSSQTETVGTFVTATSHHHAIFSSSSVLFIFLRLTL